MEKVKSLYSKLGQDKALAKATLYAQIPIFLVFLVTMIVSLDSRFIVGILIAYQVLNHILMTVFLCTGEMKGTPDSYDMSGLLDFYPINQKKRFSYLLVRTIVPMMVCGLAEVLYTAILGGTIADMTVIMVTTVLMMFYIWACYYLAYGRRVGRTKEKQVGLMNGIAWSEIGILIYLVFFLIVIYLIYE